MELAINKKTGTSIIAIPQSKACSGFSLLELVATIAIMSILLAVATLSFHTWQEKNNVEAQTRNIFVDINEARTSALTQKKYFGIVFKPNSYVLKSYSSASEAASPLTGGITAVTKNLKYVLSSTGNTITSIVDTPVIFDTSGITFDMNTIYVDPSKVSASVNCIVIASTRVNLGKTNGTACEFR